MISYSELYKQYVSKLHQLNNSSAKDKSCDLFFAYKNNTHMISYNFNYDIDSNDEINNKDYKKFQCNYIYLMLEQIKTKYNYDNIKIINKCYENNGLDQYRVWAEKNE